MGHFAKQSEREMHRIIVADYTRSDLEILTDMIRPLPRSRHVMPPTCVEQTRLDLPQSFRVLSSLSSSELASAYQGPSG